MPLHREILKPCTWQDTQIHAIFFDDTNFHTQIKDLFSHEIQKHKQFKDSKIANR